MKSPKKSMGIVHWAGPATPAVRSNDPPGAESEAPAASPKRMQDTPWSSNRF